MKDANQVALCLIQLSTTSSCEYLTQGQGVYFQTHQHFSRFIWQFHACGVKSNWSYWVEVSLRAESCFESRWSWGLSLIHIVSVSDSWLKATCLDLFFWIKHAATDNYMTGCVFVYECLYLCGLCMCFYYGQNDLVHYGVETLGWYFLPSRSLPGSFPRTGSRKQLLLVHIYSPSR